MMVALLASGFAVGSATAQGRGGGARAGGPPPTARAQAPKDFTGYWVAVVTEHWHLRMEMPPKNDFSMVPINAEARRLAGMWTPTQDAGNECRSYGAASIMRIPGRLHILWADDNTLEIDTDSGTQKRVLHFATPGAPAASAAPAQPDWQGYSVAQWAGMQVGRGGRTPGPNGNLG